MGCGRGRGPCPNSRPGAGAWLLGEERELRVQPGFFSQARTGLPLPEVVETVPTQPCTQEVLAAEQAASRSLRAGALADCRSAFRLGRASITEGCAFVTRSSDRCEQQIWTRGEVREEGADGPQVLRCALRDGRTTQVRLAERLLKHRLHDFAVSVLTHQPSCRSAHTAAVYLDRLVALSQRRRLRLCSGVEGWR